MSFQPLRILDFTRRKVREISADQEDRELARLREVSRRLPATRDEGSSLKRAKRS
jgi:hypothetical protein